MALNQEQQNILAAVQAIGTDVKAIYGVLSNKADLVNGKLPDGQTPDFAVSDYCGSVATQAAMLAVKTPANTTPQKGDWVVRTDDGKVYVVTGNDATQAASWTALSYPVAPAPDNYSYVNAYNTAKA